MSGKSTALQTALLQLIFNATALATLFENNSTSPITNIYVSLHTADPTNAGNQSSNETAYTGYARVAVARTSGGWAVSGSNPASVSPVSPVNFGQCTASPGAAITYFGVGMAASGAGTLLYSGAISPNITMAVGIIPQLTTGSAVTED